MVMSIWRRRNLTLGVQLLRTNNNEKALRSLVACFSTNLQSAIQYISRVEKKKRNSAALPRCSESRDELKSNLKMEKWKHRYRRKKISDPN